MSVFRVGGCSGVGLQRPICNFQFLWGVLYRRVWPIDLGCYSQKEIKKNNSKVSVQRTSTIVNVVKKLLSSLDELFDTLVLRIPNAWG